MDDFHIKIIKIEEIAIPECTPEWKNNPHQVIGTPSRELLDIIWDEKTLIQVHQHAESSLNEIGGVLVGKVYTWQKRTYVEIHAAIPAEKTKAGPTHITFTADTWKALYLQQRKEFPHQMIVGWYHSHPRMGIFLSRLDRSIQCGFFQSSWHVALVMNGQDFRGGFFVWDRDEIRPARGFYLATRKEFEITTQQKSRFFSYKILNHARPWSSFRPNRKKKALDRRQPSQNTSTKDQSFRTKWTG